MTSKSLTRLSTLAAGLPALILAMTVAANAQTVSAPVETLDFNRPESWALKYFTSNTLVGGLEMPRGEGAGSVRVGLELAWIPDLTAAQQRVGFNGTKQEELNKAPMFARPRVTLGLPGRWSVTLAGVPPVETFGIRPRLFAISLAHPIVTGDGWNLGTRGSAQIGSAKSAFTCPASVLAYAPGDPRNPYGCQALSSDVARLRFVSGEVDLWRTLPHAAGLSPHVTVAVNYLNAVFQVDALTFDFRDLTQLHTHGVTVSITGGVTFPLTRRLDAGVDVFYSPLTVARPPATSSAIEGLLNVRAIVTYRVR
jgi:hypothetical protein